MKEQTRIQLIHCLDETIAYLRKSESSEFSPLSPQEVIANLEISKSMLQGDTKFDRMLMEVEFAPTSTIQEISMANQWHRKYLELSNRFDDLLSQYVEA